MTAARSILILAAAATLLVGAGCGGSRDRTAARTVTTTTTSPATKPTAATQNATTTTVAEQARLTHEAFVAKMNRICRTGNRKAAAVGEDFEAAQAANDYSRMASALQKEESMYAVGQRDFGKLDPPAEDEPAFGRYTRAVNRQAGLVRRLVIALRAHDDTTISDLVDNLNAQKKVRLNAALDIGADGCGH